MNAINTDHSGADWVRDCLVHGELSELGQQVADLLGVVWRGIYHIDQKRLKEIDWQNPHYIRLRCPSDLSTFDFDLLTRLVVLAHDMAVRIEVRPLSNRYLEILFHPRSREGDGMHRHPTMEEAVRHVREAYQTAEGGIAA